MRRFRKGSAPTPRLQCAQGALESLQMTGNESVKGGVEHAQYLSLRALQVRQSAHQIPILVDKLVYSGFQVIESSRIDPLCLTET